MTESQQDIHIPTGKRGVSRREFVKGLGIVVGGIALPLGGWTGFQHWLRSPYDLLASLKHEHFAAHLGERFQVQLGWWNRLAVQLVSVKALSSNVPGESFVVQFVAPEEKALAQGTYHVRHEKLGTFLLFLVPVGGERETRSARYYEAVFNRLPG